MPYTEGSPFLENTNWRKSLAALNQLPPFSPVVARLLSMLSDEDVSFSKIAGQVERDPVIAANLLRIVNSAVYGRRGTISSIRHAISILGTKKLRNTLLAISISNLWSRLRPPRGWSMRDFNRHGSATAILADQLALEIPVACSEGAFTAGLLHDIGKLLIAVALPPLSKEIQSAAAAGNTEAEVAILGFRHEALSEAALRRWDLPSPVLEAIRRHHEAPNGPTSLAAIVRAADQCVNRLGLTSQPDLLPEGDPLLPLAELGLDGAEVRLLDGFQRELARPESLLSAIPA